MGAPREGARRAIDAALDEVSDALVRALAAAESGSDERCDALLGLADLDLSRGDGARAELWLERAAPAGPAAGLLPGGQVSTRAAEVALRMAEARLLRGDAAGARAKLEGVSGADPLDGRAAFVRGRVLSSLGDPGAFAPLLRAFVLDVAGAPDALASALARLPSDPQTRTRIRSVVDARGQQEQTRWRAAFARAEGARDAARTALGEALAAGDVGAAQPLLDAAVDDRDIESLAAALAAIPHDEADPLLGDARRLARALPVAKVGGAAALGAAAATTHPRLVAWAETIATDVARAWIPDDGTPAAWPMLLARLDGRAHDVGEAAVAARVADIAAERSRPVRLAVVGEFNAGKSTLINALIGADVAPTGILPTTAALHHLRWAPDRFARIVFDEGHDPRERIVPLGDLRAATATLAPQTIRRIELRMPLAFLVRVEILDTPGFNAPDPHHTKVARGAFEEADAALWLLDATQAMKQSERAVLEDAGRARLPIQLLINKADRMPEADVARVTESVATALTDLNIASLGPPLALSAKRALAAQLGHADTAASANANQDLLRASGWPAVQALLEERIVGQSEGLKERALRRRTSQVVADLVIAWSARAEREASTARDAAQRTRAAAQAAARLELDAEAMSRRLAASLEPQARTWVADVNGVFVGRDRGASAGDPSLAAYRVDRAMAAIAPALAKAMAAIAPEAGIGPAAIAPVARAIVRAAAGCASTETSAAVQHMMAAIGRAAVDTLVDELFSASVSPPPPTSASGVLRELGAIAAALAGRGNGGPTSVSAGS